MEMLNKLGLTICLLGVFSCKQQVDTPSITKGDWTYELKDTTITFYKEKKSFANIVMTKDILTVKTGNKNIFLNGDENILIGNYNGKSPFGKFILYDDKDRVKQIKWFHSDKSFFTMDFITDQQVNYSFNESAININKIEVPTVSKIERASDDSILMIEIYSKTYPISFVTISLNARLKISHMNMMSNTAYLEIDNHEFLKREEDLEIEFEYRTEEKKMIKSNIWKGKL